MAQGGFKINQCEYGLRLDIPGRRAPAVIGTVAMIENKYNAQRCKIEGYTATQ